VQTPKFKHVPLARWMKKGVTVAQRGYGMELPIVFYSFNSQHCLEINSHSLRSNNSTWLTFWPKKLGTRTLRM
jgi:hypothetical protein